MSDSQGTASQPTRQPLPLILIRGFGGFDVEDEKRVAYQGFNDGTVYPRKRGENYIYEGLILRFIKSGWQYHDATNVVGYYADPIADQPTEVPPELANLAERGYFSGDRLIVDVGMALSLRRSPLDPRRSLWVFRYYDLNDRNFATYGQALVRLIDFVGDLTADKDGTPSRVNIVAHSMGGLLVREAIQRTYPARGQRAEQFVNKIVTLGTPHRGISFQIFQQWLGISAADEIDHFNPTFQEDAANPESYRHFGEHFPLERLLCVVGTNYRSYGSTGATWLNRIFSSPGEYGPNYNRSDGLVKQTSAQIPGAPRTFVHKCHGGVDSLVTARESFEVATRFFFGDVRARLLLVEAAVTRGLDLFGKSELFFGVSVKPRRVDFELFHQSADAENCYGPFGQADLSDLDATFGWAGPDRLIWEGFLDSHYGMADREADVPDMVMRIDVYLGERDLWGVGFSDNVIFRGQRYLQAVLGPQLRLYCYPDERFQAPGFAPSDADRMTPAGGGWDFPIGGPGFSATLRVELDFIPPTGDPVPLASAGT